MKKPICFVVTTPFAANAFLKTHLITLAEVYEVTLFVNTKAYRLDEDIRRNVRIIHISIVRKISFGKDLYVLFDLIRHFLEIHPMAVHSITPKAGLLAMIAAYLTMVPRRFHTFTGQLWTNKTGIIRLLMKSIDWLIMISATRVFADSISQCRFLEAEGMAPNGGISVLGNGSIAGVDLSRFHPNNLARKALRNQLGVANSTPVFIFVGRLTRDKGLFDLLEAFALVNIHYPQWELWLVGPDEEGIQIKLKVRSEEHDLSVRWFDSTLSPEQYISAADILVLPSYREGFGSVIIEAAACGVPSIAYRIDGVIDAIVENSTGLFVDKGNINHLSNSMMRLGFDNNLRETLGKAAYLRAVNDFSSKTLNAIWKNFYSDELSDKY